MTDPREQTSLVHDRRRAVLFGRAVVKQLERDLAIEPDHGPVDSAELPAPEHGEYLQRTPGCGRRNGRRRRGGAAAGGTRAVGSTLGRLRSTGRLRSVVRWRSMEVGYAGEIAQAANQLAFVGVGGVRLCAGPVDWEPSATAAARSERLPFSVGMLGPVCPCQGRHALLHTGALWASFAQKQSKVKHSLMLRIFLLLIVLGSRLACRRLAPVPGSHWPGPFVRTGPSPRMERDAERRLKVPFRRGWSSPVVADGARLADDGVKERGGSLRLLAFDVDTGREAVNVEVFRTPDVSLTNQKNSRASPTPILDGDRVYVHFGADGTAALTTSGELVWKKRFPYESQHGNGGSPTLYRDLLIFSCDGSDEAFVVALDKQTGKVRGRPAASAVDQAYSTLS